jgi:hypothetical protein
LSPALCPALGGIDEKKKKKKTKTKENCIYLVGREVRESRKRRYYVSRVGLFDAQKMD